MIQTLTLSCFIVSAAVELHNLREMDKLLTGFFTDIVSQYPCITHLASTFISLYEKCNI